MKKFIIIGAMALLLTLLLAACSTPPEATPCPEPEACPDCPSCPECEACPEVECPTCPEPVVAVVPFEEAWANSAHNDAEAEAFTHWNEDDPPEVSTSCANCHTPQGYVEYISTGEVASPIPAPAGTIQCATCHNPAASTLDSVKFPQKEVMEEGGEPENVVLTGLGSEARCMVCHQGRASTSTVDSTIEKFGGTEDVDAVPAPVEDSTLGFINIHYYPAGATLYGTQVKGGYQYDGKMYDAKFRHVEGIETCTGCHSPHSLEVKLETCQHCHEGVEAVEDLRNTRMEGSLADYNGNGDVEEGIDAELQGLKDVLYGAILEYANTVVGEAIVYESHTYPYFFIDTNADGEAGEDEANYGNKYAQWTPRLLKAAYNYQMASKDPGAYAHNAKYMVQLLYDSTEDLNVALGTIDMSAMHRSDPGHFAGNTEAFRHWDEDGEVPGRCAKCHSSDGLPLYLAEGVNIATETANGFMCTTCHNEEEWPARYVVDEVSFPSGAVLSYGEGVESNLCLECHQGRSSTVTVDRAIGDSPDNEPAEGLGFSNIHYFAAGATIFGNEAMGAYQFAGSEYVGLSSHPVNQCADCHEVHALEVKLEACATCHAGAADPQDTHTYRMDATDYNGNGDVEEGISAELDSFATRLYEAMQAYATANGTPIVYESHTYPYFFNDDGNGEADPGEANYGNRYTTWTPNLLRAAYNYQYYQKDPGAFTHNPKYVLQVLYDSIQAVGGDVSDFTRP